MFINRVISGFIVYCHRPTHKPLSVHKLFSPLRRFCAYWKAVSNHSRCEWRPKLTSLISSAAEEQNKEVLQDVDDEAQWDPATNNHQLEKPPPPRSPSLYHLTLLQCLLPLPWVTFLLSPPPFLFLACAAPWPSWATGHAGKLFFPSPSYFLY